MCSSPTAQSLTCAQLCKLSLHCSSAASVENSGSNRSEHVLPVSVCQSDDVIVEAESSLSASGDDEAGDGENDIRQLKARRHDLTNKLAQQQKRRDKIQVKHYIHLTMDFHV